MNLKTGEKLQIEQPKPKEKKAAAASAEPVVGTIELYCKAGPDGKSLGDCPFTQYVSMVLHAKDLPFTTIPTAPDAKPDWLVDEFEGKMPCLVHDGEAYTESSEIVDYLQFFFPTPNLAPSSAEKRIEQATATTKDLFPTLAKCIKNLDKEKDPELVDAVLAELKKIDNFLLLGGSVAYLCGNDITVADCSLAPKLYHAKTTLAQFKNTVIPPEFVALNTYMDNIFSSKPFEASSYPPDVIVWGWNVARGTNAQ